jgi:hypothetical protein
LSQRYSVATALGKLSPALYFTTAHGSALQCSNYRTIDTILAID